ncbi:small GTP-binding protein domain-containing protein [Chryseobacterium taeanense]|uniref:non-specific serine/threonine protein kinase n=1 Tax=Chryseobacterium taeanense TaxID=311334 RepID=A0A1G8HT13_9FLAO|nr:COR domain-containing protein [Chryseobacterium taeanense]SDI09796.1 small GTP-binding protein domain-containing protein [Chryseobacterium taeanense]
MKPHIKNKLKDLKYNTHKVQLTTGRLKRIPNELKICTEVKYLDLFGNSIPEIPDWFFQFKRLEHLSLKNNTLKELPTIVFTLENIKYLNLADNQINLIDGHYFENLMNIEKVDISYNQITLIPEHFIEYPKCKDLSIKGNRLQVFPKAISDVYTLEKLDLSENKIASIEDDAFDCLENLIELDLSFNELKYLPTSIGKLKKLKRLNLSGNKISSLPKEFENLTSLEFLDFDSNPIGKVPIEISSQGASGIINYYLSLGDNVQLFEAKLLIVGQGNVGKTYLMNRLIHNSIPETNTTEGIDIKSWKVKTQSSPDFRVNVWDFGGQEIYHSTHQFFLTNRSLYLLVWEARTDQHLISFDYWLNVIRLLSNNSPIIIVLNKIDERIINIDERSLKAKFKNIVSFHQVSASSGQNIDLLTTKIQDEINSLPLIGDKLPKVWLEIRTILESLDSNYISAEEYLNICNQHGLSNQRALFLSQYFHDLGVFLHFQDDNLLRNILFLKPEWATNAVYKILDSKEVIARNGEFDPDMLDSILYEFQRDKHPYIVTLMKKFELCFEVEQSIFLIPELLKPEKLEFDWDYNDNLRFEYHYDFMPAGIMARFIVRTRKLIYDKTFWKNGVIIQRENTRALITTDQYSRKLFIWIHGNNASFLLEIIRKELNDIHQSLNYPDVPEKIPCNCPECINSMTPHLFNYVFVRRIGTENTFKTIPCEVSATGVNVHKLLGLYKIDNVEPENNPMYSLDKILNDLIEIGSRILERKFQKRIENLINDDIVDLLRTQGHNVADQTRSGISSNSKDAGELDIMIRMNNGIPVTIIECFRLESCGPKNTVVSGHLIKLLSKYDTHELQRKFIIVFGEAERFDNLWVSYSHYIRNLNSNDSYGNKYPISGFSVRDELHSFANMKVGISRHDNNGETVEVVHILLNMK